MGQRALRFGIRDGDNRAATWKLWTETSGGRSELYLVNRSAGGALKASLHESGRWHIAFSKKTFDNQVKGTSDRFNDRFLELWPRPPEIAPGLTLAFRICTPYSALTNSVKEGKYRGVKWLPNATDMKATEIDIIITTSKGPKGGWPGKNNMTTSLIGSFPSENGSTVWAVYMIVDLPDFSKLKDGKAHFFKGFSKEDLKKLGLRLMVFDQMTDGSRIIYDLPIIHKYSSAQDID
jgi:hypothetical protein